ncbi:MAG: S41 family peptidase [Bacilli bacterium]|nr:S41 family peptidase [Bacilli bacterium]
MANTKNSNRKKNTVASKKAVDNNKVINNNKSYNKKKDGLLTKIKNKKNQKVYVKKFKIDVLDVFIIVIFTALVSSFLTALIFNYQYKKHRSLNESLLYSESFSKFAKIYDEVKNNYYEEVDEEEMLSAALDGMLKYLGDKYSIYIGDSDSEELISSLEGSYEGIGIVCSYDIVIAVYENSPAAKAGIEVGDSIIEINGVVLDNKVDVGSLIKKDSSNKIVVKRNNKMMTFNVKVDTVVMTSVVSDIFEKDNKKVGYIKVSSFASNTYDQFNDQLVDLEDKDIDYLIVDLRNNTGGYLNVTTKMVNLFLSKGSVIYSLENKDGVKEYEDDTKENRDYKIVVLINGNTASAAEIFASALKDSYGATLVGEKSYGKGKVQTLVSYGDSIVKYTSSKWLRPNGECVDEVGITPDVEVKNTYKDNTIFDNQLEEAINVLVKEK